jgi:hypothetical protein
MQAGFLRHVLRRGGFGGVSYAGAAAVGPPPYGRGTEVRRAAGPVRPCKTGYELHSSPRLTVRRRSELLDKTLYEGFLVLIRTHSGE